MIIVETGGSSFEFLSATSAYVIEGALTLCDETGKQIALFAEGRWDVAYLREQTEWESLDDLPEGVIAGEAGPLRVRRLNGVLEINAKSNPSNSGWVSYTEGRHRRLKGPFKKEDV